MTAFFRSPRSRMALVFVACLALAGCILLPGKFASTLDLRSDGTFTFTYDGQMLFLPLSEEFDKDPAVADLTAAPAETELWVEPCYDSETFAERDCTEEELAQRKKDREDLAAAAAAEEKKRNDQMMRFLAGIDPKDPEAGNKLAALLERQAGWDKVTYRGNGVFDVSYRMVSRIDHDFAFPVVEGMDYIPPFVQIHRRDGGQIRINAPGYSTRSASNGMNPALFMLGTGFGSGGEAAPASDPILDLIDGSFTITTDGEVLANNTDEGPAILASGKQLVWRVNATSEEPPTALIRIR